MQVLDTLGALIEFTPVADISVVWGESPNECEFLYDQTPFVFRVGGRLEDGQIFYGLWGPVVSGPERYHGLIANIIIRGDGSDWRIDSECHANLRVGPSKVVRRHAYDFRHPAGVAVTGYPVYATCGEIRVISPDSASEASLQGRRLAAQPTEAGSADSGGEGNMTIQWEGASGTRYRYWPAPIGSQMCEYAGNYLFAKFTGSGYWLPLYIGQTTNLNARPGDHEKEECAIRNGGTHIYAHTTEGGEHVRLAEVKDLIDRWNPVCNVG